MTALVAAGLSNYSLLVRVAAYNGSGQSSYSNSASTQTDEQTAAANINLSVKEQEVYNKPVSRHAATWRVQARTSPADREQVHNLMK